MCNTEYLCAMLRVSANVFYCTQHCVCFTAHNTVCVVLYTCATLCHYCVHINTTASPLDTRIIR
jgi:hypothetical protein